MARPCLVARRRLRQGGAHESLYVAVIEPFRGGPATTVVRELAAKGVGGRAIALWITRDGREDTLLVSWDGPAGARMKAGVRTMGGAELDGRVGFVSEATGGRAAAFLIGGRKLRKGELLLETPRGVYEGEIASTLRTADGDECNALVTSVAFGKLIPEGTRLRGKFAIVTMPGVKQREWNTSGNGYTHGYAIARVERKGEKTLIHTDGDHGLRMGEGRMVTEACAPGRSYSGRPRFVIYESSHVVSP